MTRSTQRVIEVWADWEPLPAPRFMGKLYATPARGGEVFSFDYDGSWLSSEAREQLDPELGLFAGPQYGPQDRPTFGVFLDSSPDRWGRMLMRRREAREAQKEARPVRKLFEADYLLGVQDAQRLGALRFKTEPAGPFLDDRTELATPPMARLRDLEHASLGLEEDGSEERRDYDRWLRLLLAPGGSLGGARPKAGLMGADNALWIAKFPGWQDRDDSGAWEMVVHRLAALAGIRTSQAEAVRLSRSGHTFLTRRFDRAASGRRLHFASALTLLRRADGDDHSTGASYLELAEVLIRQGAEPRRDLEELWRRIVFFMCVSNADDHLRNHGFLLVPGRGWELSPAYDMNPIAEAEGLRLNVSESDNTQDLELARSVAPHFRVEALRARKVIAEVSAAVRGWKKIASELQITRSEQQRMSRAFRLAEAGRGKGR